MFTELQGVTTHKTVIYLNYNACKNIMHFYKCTLKKKHFKTLFLTNKTVFIQFEI
jgi:hypothetical protein